MAQYEANFNLDTLYQVASAMDSYSAQQDYATSRIESETRFIENIAHEAVANVEARLQEAQHELANIRARLRDAEWHLDNCTQTDEEGNTTAEYEYWIRVVQELYKAEEAQQEEVNRITNAYHDVVRLADDAISRSVQIRSLTQAYQSATSGMGSAASSAIRHCADAMLDYWNLNI